MSSRTRHPTIYCPGGGKPGKPSVLGFADAGCAEPGCSYGGIPNRKGNLPAHAASWEYKKRVRELAAAQQLEINRITDIHVAYWQLLATAEDVIKMSRADSPGYAIVDNPTWTRLRTSVYRLIDMGEKGEP